MSREYMVLIVPEPSELMIDLDDSPARIFMRFTEQPSDDFLGRIADENPGHRIYCLMGASSWYSARGGDQ